MRADSSFSLSEKQTCLFPFSRSLRPNGDCSRDFRRLRKHFIERKFDSAQTSPIPTEFLQASPSGMASASQADFGGSDSRRLLQKKGHAFCVSLSFAGDGLKDSPHSRRVRARKRNSSLLFSSFSLFVFAALIFSNSRRLLQKKGHAFCVSLSFAGDGLKDSPCSRRVRARKRNHPLLFFSFSLFVFAALNSFSNSRRLLQKKGHAFCVSLSFAGDGLKDSPLMVYIETESGEMNGDLP